MIQFLDLEGVKSLLSYIHDNSDHVIELTRQHASLVLEAVVLATVLSVALGILSHRIKALRGPVLGIASILLTIPSLALFTIFIPLVGLGRTPSLIALVLYALLPIVRNTVTGLDQVDSSIVESAKGVGLSRTQVLLRVELPLAWPVIATGIRVAVLLTTGIAAIATLVGGGGLGDFIKDGLQDYPLAKSVERIWTGVIFTVLLGLILDFAFGILRWLTTAPQPAKPLSSRLLRRRVTKLQSQLAAGWSSVQARVASGEAPEGTVDSLAPDLRSSATTLSRDGFTYDVRSVLDRAKAPADDPGSDPWNGLLDTLRTDTLTASRT